MQAEKKSLEPQAQTESDAASHEPRGEANATNVTGFQEWINTNVGEDFSVKFKSMGAEDLADLDDVEEKDLREIGMPVLKARKLLKVIRSSLLAQTTGTYARLICLSLLCFYTCLICLSLLSLLCTWFLVFSLLYFYRE